ncbi:MAG: hypothetical protein K2Y21_04430 [Phycisphaerales bacterium]|nr:hypothetical protein [Phycisphaerales bacterium]
MSADPRDLVDLSGLRQGSEAADSVPAAARPYLQVFFRCANHYQRVYRSADGTAYNARCPRCAKPVRFKVGEGGSDSRRFEINCGL